MAGEWMKVRLDLPEDPAVVHIASILKLEIELVVGKLINVWRWANRHLRTGNAPGVTELFIDSLAHQNGFAKAMEQVGWMRIKSGGVVFPRFEVHNSQGAKTRALTSNRVKRSRNARSASESLPEKRREEKSIKQDDACASSSPKPAKPDRGDAGGMPPATANGAGGGAGAASVGGIAWNRLDGWSGITSRHRDTWAKAYPACDLDRQLAAMHAWLLVNPAKAVKRSWARFCTNWLARQQERGGDAESNRPPQSARTHQGHPSGQSKAVRDEIARLQAQENRPANRPPTRAALESVA